MARTRTADKRLMKGDLQEFMKNSKGLLQKVTAWMMILMMFLSIYVSADADITSIIFTSHDNYVNDKKLRISPTAYAKKEGASESGNATWWWLRSPGNRQNQDAIVNNKAKLDNYSVNTKKGSVRPVIWLNLEPEIIKERGIPVCQGKVRVGDIVKFGKYPQTKDGTDETPIEWLVLDYDMVNEKALVLSRYGLDAQPYHKTYKDITWETCSLRAWLNKDFLNKAFTKEERSAILKTDVDNSAEQGDSEWKTSGAKNIQDQIFLLSFSEANNYLGVTRQNNASIRVAPTAYAKARGAYSDSNYKTEEGATAGWWWLRSPGFYQDLAALVNYFGSLDASRVYRGSVCVRPAFWLNLESDIISDARVVVTRKVDEEASETSESRDEMATIHPEETQLEAETGENTDFGRNPQTENEADESITGIEYEEKTKEDFDQKSPAIYTGKILKNSIYSEKDTSKPLIRDMGGKTVDILYVGLVWMIVRYQDEIGYVKREYIDKESVVLLDPENTPAFNVIKQQYIATVANENGCYVRKTMSNELLVEEEYSSYWVKLFPGTRISIWQIMDGWAIVIYMRSYGYIDLRDLKEIIPVSSTVNPVDKTQPIAAFTSYYKMNHLLPTTSESSRVMNLDRIWNIGHAVEKINETGLLKPSDTFDANLKNIGPFGEYRQVNAMVDGKTVTASGSGTSQVSSTVYNVVIQLPGLVIECRRPHGGNGASYLPVHCDAAIGSESLNLIFHNEYDFPIRLEGYTAGDGALLILAYNAEESDEINDEDGKGENIE